jgi:NADPH-dependent 2,4-dienoyl-CoA reductase/sulfur reductase-like enzyme
MIETFQRGEASATFDVLVVGAGPAGIAAACIADEAGNTVGIVDENPGIGGQIWRGTSQAAPSSDAALARCQDLDRSRVRLLLGARVVAQPDAGVFIAETAEQTYKIECKRLIIATGAREGFLPFPRWTLPGIFGAGGLQALVKSGFSVQGKRIVVAGSGPLLLAVAAYLKKSGANVLQIAEQAPHGKISTFKAKLVSHPAKVWQALRLKLSLGGVPYRTGVWPVRAGGSNQLGWVELADGKRIDRVECDHLACGFNLVPNTELAQLLGCELENGFVRVDEFQETTQAGIYCAGEPTGIGGVETALIEGEIAGSACAGHHDYARTLFSKRASAWRFAALLEETFELRDELRELASPDTFVCRCEDVTYARMAEQSSWRSAKLQTRCGMGPCQGRVCGPAAEFLFGWKVDSVRPPIFPARLESLATASVRE